MIRIDFLLEDSKLENWIETENIKVSSILMILKTNLGFKDQAEIIRKTNLRSGFLKIKLCWRTDQEFSEVSQILNDLVRFFKDHPNYYSGRYLLNQVVGKGGTLLYCPPYKWEDEQKPLLYWTLEKTIERWIKEKF